MKKVEIPDLHITDFTCGGLCSGCGACCTAFLPMDFQEINRIRRYIKKHGIMLNEEEKDTVESVWHRFTKCPFRDDVEKCCRVYPVRPAICRTFVCNKSNEVLVQERDAAYKKAKMRDTELRVIFFGKKSVLPQVCDLTEKMIA